MKYRVGVLEDTLISVSAASMGLDDDEGGPFNLGKRIYPVQMDRSMLLAGPLDDC